MDYIDQSVPRKGAKTAHDDDDDVTRKRRSEIDYMLGDDEAEALRKQAMVDQLRAYGGGAMPSMYGSKEKPHAPQPLEYAATLGTRLASMSGQTDARSAERRALEEFYRRVYGSGAGAAPGATYRSPDTDYYGGSV